MTKTKRKLTGDLLKSYKEAEFFTGYGPRNGGNLNKMSKNGKSDQFDDLKLPKLKGRSNESYNLRRFCLYWNRIKKNPIEVSVQNKAKATLISGLDDAPSRSFIESDICL